MSLRPRLNIAHAYDERRADFYDNPHRAESYVAERYFRNFAIFGYKHEGGYYFAYSELGFGASQHSIQDALFNLNRDILDNHPEWVGYKDLVYRDEYFVDPDVYENEDLILGYEHIFIRRPEAE